MLVLLGLGLAYWQRQNIYDQIQLHSYDAAQHSAEVQLASDDTMTASARKVYLVNHPALKTKADFSGLCPSGTEQTVVLGCYQGGQRGIYVLKVDNAELQGIEQVTAAHEMLHAEYDRLSTKDRTYVDGLLEDYYEHDLQDDAIKQTMDAYKKTEPNDVVNEMHSVFGTEIANLPAPLEKYYQRYFSDRSKVTGYYAQYQQAFTSRQQQIKDYDSQLTSLKGQITSLQSSVTTQSKDLEIKRSQLNQLRDSDNIQAYNSGVDSFNAAVNSYNADVRRLQGLIGTYNDLVAKRNTIAFEEQQLVQDISSGPVQTAPASK